MFDLADPFFEGVKISPKHKFRGEPVPKNNCGWIKRLLIILCLSNDKFILRLSTKITSNSAYQLRLYSMIFLVTLYIHENYEDMFLVLFQSAFVHLKRSVLV